MNISSRYERLSAATAAASRPLASWRARCTYIAAIWASTVFGCQPYRSGSLIFSLRLSGPAEPHRATVVNQIWKNFGAPPGGRWHHRGPGVRRCRKVAQHSPQLPAIPFQSHILQLAHLQTHCTTRQLSQFTNEDCRLSMLPAAHRRHGAPGICGWP